MDKLDLKKELQAKVKIPQNVTLEVGIVKSLKYPNGLEVAMNARIQELGLGVPARPFITKSIIKNSSKWFDKLNLFLQNNMDLENGFNLLGVVIKNDIQEEITELRTPPNKASTIKAKKSSNPLIDTGFLRRSIDYKVSK